MKSEEENVDMHPATTGGSGDLDDDDGTPRKSKHPSTVELTSALGIRTKARSRRVWTREEDEKLRRLVAHWGDQRGKNSHWDQISAQFESRTNKDCRKRWFHSLDPTLKRGRWTEDEDRILLEAYSKMGSVWNKIAQLIPGRTDDQCSKRYNDVLDPSVRDRLREWTKAEDAALMQLVELHGTQWRTISQSMEGRTGLTCRNRWRKIVAPAVPKGSTPAPGAKRPPSKRMRSNDSMEDNSDELPENMDLDDAVMTDSAPVMGPPFSNQPRGSTNLTSPSLLYSSSNPGSVDSIMGGTTSQSGTPFETFKSPNYNPMSVASLGDTSLRREEYGPPTPLGDSQLMPHAKASSSAPKQEDYYTTSTTTHYTFSLDDGLQKQGDSGTNGADRSNQVSLSRDDLESLVKMAAANGQQIVIQQHNYQYHHHHHHYYYNDHQQQQSLNNIKSHTTSRPSQLSPIMRTAEPPQSNSYYNRFSNASSHSGLPSSSTSVSQSSSTTATAAPPNSSNSTSSKPMNATDDVANLSALFSELEELEDFEGEYNPFTGFTPITQPQKQSHHHRGGHHRNSGGSTTSIPMSGSGAGTSPSSAYKVDLQFAFEGIPYNPS